VATRTLSWSGPRGGEIGVGFDDAHFGMREMRGEIERMEAAYPNLPDEFPQGTSFLSSKARTGHLAARFRMGDTVYRNVAERSLRHLWDPVHLMNQLARPA
jgi:hypothetical protein